MEDRTKEVERLNEKLAQLDEIQKVETNVKNNVCEFNYKDKLYRLRRLKGSDKDEVNLERAKKYTKLLQDPDFIFRKELVELLKLKNIDIIKLETELNKEYLHEQDLCLKLAKCEILSDIAFLRKQVEESRVRRSNLFFEIEDHLVHCIEKQLEDFTRMYFLYLLLEIKNGETWERLFKFYKEFQDYEDESLLGRAAGILAVLVYHETI